VTVKRNELAVSTDLFSRLVHPHFGRLETPSPPGTFFALRLFRVWPVQFWQSRCRAGSVRQSIRSKWGKQAL